MKNITKLLQEEYEPLKTTKELEGKILNRTIYKTSNQAFKKIAISFSSIVLVFLLSLTVVYADDIREYLKSWKIRYDFNNAASTILGNESYEYKTLKDNTLKTDNEGKILDYRAVEETLGFKILKSSSQRDEKINYTTYLNKDNKTIAEVYLRLPDLYIDKENLSFQASFITAEADEEIKKSTLDDETGFIKKYVAKKTTKFGSEVLLYTYERITNDGSFTNKETKTINCLSAAFVYDSVKYSIMSFNEINVTDMMAIINSLSY